MPEHHDERKKQLKLQTHSLVLTLMEIMSYFIFHIYFHTGFMANS